VQKLPYFEAIDTASIDLADRTYSLTPFAPTAPEEALIESVRRFGILHPPIVKQKQNYFIAVTGRKRIAAARQVEAGGSVLCLLVPETTKESYIYELIVEENRFSEKFSVAEQAVLFDRLLKLRPVEALLPLLSQLGYKPQKFVLEELVSILSLPINTLRAVHDGTIPFKSTQKLRRLSPAGQEALMNIITSFHLGGSKQSKIIDYCIEIGMRTNLGPEKLFNEFFANEEPEQKENIPQRTAALLGWLHNKCFPGLTGAEDEFRRSVAQLHLPAHLQLKHTTSFEDDQVTLTVHFHDMETARRILPEIIKVTGR